MHKSASDGLRMHLRVPKISKLPGAHAPRPPHKTVGLRPFLPTKGAPVVQFAQGLLNPLGSPDLRHTHSWLIQLQTVCLTSNMGGRVWIAFEDSPYGVFCLLGARSVIWDTITHQWEPVNWNTGILDWSTGILEWSTGILDWSTGILDWNTGLKYWNTGLEYWNTELEYWTGILEYWTGILDWNTGILVWSTGILVWSTGLDLYFIAYQALAVVSHCQDSDKTAQALPLFWLLSCIWGSLGTRLTLWYVLWLHIHYPALWYALWYSLCRSGIFHQHWLTSEGSW